jgi:hypothetical protein
MPHSRIYNRTYDPNQVFQDDPDPADAVPVPIDRAAINRANAQKSTGPVTPEGKEIAAKNALKHGLTGNTVLLDTDDAEAYQQRLDEYVAQYQPVTLEERRLVQSIHDCAWRLDRIVNHESAIYAKGRIELQFCFHEIPADQRKSFMELEIAERNAKQLRNLHLHEARLQRQRAKDIAALKELLQQRQTAEATPPAAAKPVSVSPDGFVFANPVAAPQTGLQRSDPDAPSFTSDPPDASVPAQPDREGGH